MRRLVAVVGIVAFLSACSDSSTTAPRSGIQPGGRLAESDPPPPPLSGAGSGFLEAFGGDFASTATAVTSAQPLCTSGHTFAINYLFKYLINNTANNEMAHLDISGSATGNVTMHDLGNGKSDAKGRVTDADFALDITDGTGVLSAAGFTYSISGTLTNLATGQKCQAVGSLSGDLFSTD